EEGDDLPALSSRSWMVDGTLNETALALRHLNALRAASGYEIHTNITYVLENGSARVTTITDPCPPSPRPSRSRATKSAANVRTIRSCIAFTL
ncbi:MAG TPA: hypothetical protein RMG48_12190, partial [Myxococcales bacterium LLY-WYZ-16_1]|nr:hypothetical protein [Myxococcales bacterium LLY-WYZ-16_1]